MNKSELVSAAAAEAGLPQSDTKKVVDAVTRIILGEVRRGGDVRISDFGTFRKKTLAARSGKSPATGEPYSVPARDVLGFKAASNVVA